jgi:hypothetical protein
LGLFGDNLTEESGEKDELSILPRRVGLLWLKSVRIPTSPLPSILAAYSLKFGNLTWLVPQMTDLGREKILGFTADLIALLLDMESSHKVM